MLEREIVLFPIVFLFGMKQQPECSMYSREIYIIVQDNTEQYVYSWS